MRATEREHTCYAGLLDVDEVWLEHALGGFESFGSNFDYASVGELAPHPGEEAEVSVRGG